MEGSVANPEASPKQPTDSPPAQGQKSVGVTIAKNSFWLLIDNVAAMVTSFTCSIMVARSLGPDRMGEYNYLLWFATVLKMLSEVAMPATFRKFASEFMGRGDLSTLKTMARVIFRLLVKLAFVGGTIGLVVVQVFFRPDQKVLASLAVLTVVPALMLTVPASLLFATENLRHNVIGSVSAMAVNLIGVTTSVVLGWGLTGIVSSLLVSRIADCTIRYVLYRRYVHLPGQAEEHLDPALRRRLAKFAALQLVLTFLYMLMFDRMEVFFLHKLAAAREIAFFSISFTLVQYLLIPPQTLAGSASVSIQVSHGRDPREAARIAGSATWFTILFGAPELFGVAALADPLLRLMYGAKYLPAIPVLTTMAFFGLALAASQSAQFLLVAAERQIFYIGLLIFTGLIDVLGNVMLVPSMGALGAAYAKGISQAIAASGFLGFMVWKFQVRLPLGRIARLLFACLVMHLGVRFVVQHVGPLPALMVGIPLGIVIFLVLTRWLRCLDKTDSDRLRQLDRLLPGRVRSVYRAILEFLVPVRPAVAPPPSAAPR